MPCDSLTRSRACARRNACRCAPRDSCKDADGRKACASLELETCQIPITGRTQDSLSIWSSGVPDGAEMRDTHSKAQKLSQTRC